MCGDNVLMYLSLLGGIGERWIVINVIRLELIWFCYKE
jgi:hypothetical protein